MLKSVLIIDDNQDDILITRRVISKIDPEIEVEAVSSGQEGLDFLRKGTEHPTLVLLDLKMPGMSGFDTLRRIRADKSLQDLPVVVVTSSSLESDEKESLACGSDGFLHKAVDMDRFSKDVALLFDRLLHR